MTDKPPEPDDDKLTDDEREANRRFRETLGRLVNTPHQPHKPAATEKPKPDRNPKSA
jgi:hypothetical protein